MREYKLIDKILSIIVSFISIFFIISASILPPLVFKGFYYMQITPLNIEEESGYSRDEIIEAFDDVIEFCWKGGEFKCGSLPFSEEGASHFRDCIPLFRLDLIVFIITSSLLLIYLLLVLLKKIRVYRFRGLSPITYGSIITLLLITVIGSLAATNFDKAFAIFHKIFFPGKDNWLFNPFYDPVILILPEQFFMNCGILIGVNLIILSAFSIIYGILKKRNI